MYKNLYRSICVLYMWYLHVIMRRTFPTQLQLQVVQDIYRFFPDAAVCGVKTPSSMGDDANKMKAPSHHLEETWPKQPKFMKAHPWRWCPGCEKTMALSMSSTKFLVLLRPLVVKLWTKLRKEMSWWCSPAANTLQAPQFTGPNLGSFKDSFGKIWKTHGNTIWETWWVLVG